MTAIKAIDVSGVVLGEKVTVEVRDPEASKLRYVTGLLVEWRGVANTNPDPEAGLTAMFLARVKTPDSKGGAQVMFGPEDVLYLGDRELDIKRIEDELNGN